MAESQWDHATQVREALRAIVAEHGQEALSNARLMQGLMGDLLPNAPREAQVLLSAAEQALAGTIHDHVAHGMDSGTAVRLAATSFAARTMFAPEVCRWVAGELATAVGIEVEPEPPLMSYQPIVAPEPGASAEPKPDSDLTRTGQRPRRAHELHEPPPERQPAAAPQTARRPRLAILAVGLALAVGGAAVAVTLIVSHRGHAAASRPPAPHSSTPGAARHAAGPATTQVQVYEPWAPSGLAHGFRSHATVNGRCFSTAITSARDDAFRCMSGNYLLDPCFSNPYQSSGAPVQVACPYPSPDSVTIISLSSALPTLPASQASTPTPWLLILTAGQKCWSTAGAAATQVGGMTNTFVCGRGVNLFGQPQRATIWTIFEQTKAPTNLTLTTIAKVYE